ncbi:Structural maintenance of chromosomes protein 1 [Cystobasidiomycetes sp. EMM_F5]
MQRDFEAEHLQTVVERVEILSKTVIKEESDLKEATEKKKAIEEELGGLSAQVDTVKEALAEYEATLVEKQAAVEVAKKAEAKAKKAIDGALKEMASLNTSIEKLASQRMDIYKRCKLEEINLPFEVGSLNDVPDEEVRSAVLSRNGIER